MLDEMRDVPTLSNGFIDATTRKPSAARTTPIRGTVTSRSAIAVSNALSVSSGARLTSSTYRNPPDRIARTSGPSMNVASEKRATASPPGDARRALRWCCSCVGAWPQGGCGMSREL